MKKVIAFLLLLAVTASARIVEKDINWVLSVSSGGDSLTYPVSNDTLSLRGADFTIYSKTYENLGGGMSCQIAVWKVGTTTLRYQFTVQGAQTHGDTTRWEPLYDLDWDGQYVDSCVVRVQTDSCTVGEDSPCFYVSPLTCPKFRFRVKSLSTFTGTAKVSGGITREEE